MQLAEISNVLARAANHPNGRGKIGGGRSIASERFYSRDQVTTTRNLISGGVSSRFRLPVIDRCNGDNELFTPIKNEVFGEYQAGHQGLYTLTVNQKQASTQEIISTVLAAAEEQLLDLFHRDAETPDHVRVCEDFHPIALLAFKIYKTAPRRQNRSFRGRPP